VNDRERRELIDAITRESCAERTRILASLDSFDSWLSLACPAVHRTVGDRAEPVRNWLRMAFG
jgi:hypothetical protein